MRSLLAILLLVMSVTTVLANGATHSLQIIIDNSAALQGSAEAELFKQRLMYQISEFRKQRDARGQREVYTTPYRKP